MLIALAALMVSSGILSVILVLLVRSFSRRVGFLDRPGAHKGHKAPTPYGGGIALFFATLVPVFVAAGTVSWLSAHGIPTWMPASLEGVWIHLAGAVSRFGQLMAVLVGALVIVALGLIDDLWKLPAPLKFAVEIAVGILLVVTGVRITALVGPGILGGAVTVVWIVAITNAFNFLDNMDGLSAGVALVVAVIMAVVSLQSGQFFIAALLAPLVGALAGFLLFNYPPASIYMGDTGSLFIGYFLSVLAVLVTFYEGPTESFRPVLLPLLMFSVPIYDMTSVILIRLRAGVNPMRGDRRHFSHRLVNLGLSPRLAVLAIHLLALGVGLSAVLLYLVPSRAGEVLTIIQAAVIFLVIVVLEHAGPKGAQP